MMNAQKSRLKLSALEKMLNRLVVGMVLLELSVCVAVAVM
jgi:hypothetical protein